MLVQLVQIDEIRYFYPSDDVFFLTDDVESLSLMKLLKGFEVVDVQVVLSTLPDLACAVGLIE